MILPYFRSFLGETGADPASQASSAAGDDSYFAL